MPRLSVLSVLLLTLVIAAPSAQAPAPAGATAPQPAAPVEEWSATQHTITLGRQAVPYTANAGTTAIKDDAGEVLGMMYSVAYVRSDVTDHSTRPVTFLFNGGPVRRRCGCTWGRWGRSGW